MDTNLGIKWDDVAERISEAKKSFYVLQIVNSEILEY